MGDVNSIAGGMDTARVTAADRDRAHRDGQRARYCDWDCANAGRTARNRKDNVNA